MRITIETTASEPTYSIKSVVEVPYDDIDLPDMRELIDQALRGHGFAWETDEDKGAGN